MTTVVFTGPAVDSFGNAVVRASLVSACEKKSICVREAIGADTDLLVASRVDTTKAKKAAARGVIVIGYPEFISRFLSDVPVVTSGVFNFHTKGSSRLALDLMVPDFTDAAMEKENDPCP